MTTFEPSIDPRRLALAQELLQEAVYRSRGEQAGAALLRARPPGTAGVGNCGLGEKAAVVLDLTPRAEVVYAELFPAGLDAAAVAKLESVLAAWVKRQDALDRRRNHFLKDFRNTHGYNRAVYDAAQLELFEGGLERVNADAREELGAAAVDLLQVVG